MLFTVFYFFLLFLKVNESEKSQLFNVNSYSNPVASSTDRMPESTERKYRTKTVR